MPIHEFHHLQCVVLTSFVTEWLYVKRLKRTLKGGLYIFVTHIQQVKVKVVRNYMNFITC